MVQGESLKGVCMKTVGFVISRKENEKRRALCLEDIEKIRHKDMLFFEKGYFDDFGISDDEIEAHGCKTVSREQVLKKDIICDPKVGDAQYLEILKNQTVFGWTHAVRNRDITDRLVSGSLTSYAWEDMFEKGRHIFYRNNEIAGEVAVLHAYQIFGKMPYETKVALLGRGNVGNGALKILTLLGADVTIYGRRQEELFRQELDRYDVIVNAVLWDTKRKDHIVSKADLLRMKKGSMIVDISCDKNGAVESSVPTTLDEPVYYESGVLHYVVDHTPTIVFKTATREISKQVVRFLDLLIEGKEDIILKDAKNIECGKIIDKRIIEFQSR